MIEQLMTRDDEQYLAIVVQADALRCYQQLLREYLGEVDYARYNASQYLRDGAGYHITVVGPAEFKQLTGSSVEVLIANQSVQYRFVRLGRAQREGDTAYFVVCESEELQQFRASLGLERKDLHVTLGFENVDVHEIAKDDSTLISTLVEMT